ncbi:hypothetical protein QYM36_007556, partial [Artemia franciscana]
EREMHFHCSGFLTRINIRDTNYDNTITPNEALQNETSVKPQDIGLIVYIYSVSEISDDEAVATIKFHLQVFWEDLRLQMKRKKELRVPFYLTKCFWTPSFYFPEVAGSEQREQIMFSIQPNGSIRTTSLISLKIPYDDNLHVYP